MYVFSYKIKYFNNANEFYYYTTSLNFKGKNANKNASPKIRKLENWFRDRPTLVFGALI